MRFLCWFGWHKWIISWDYGEYLITSKIICSRCQNISIADQSLDCVQLANRGFAGETKITEDALKKIGINPEYVRSLLRNYACVYAIMMRGARLKGESEEA